jgi:RimJ/RimL family protein N-acetyltransferase
LQSRSFHQLVGERIVVRRFRDRDAAALSRYRSDPEVARYQAWDAPYPEHEAAAFIASLRDSSPGSPGEWFQFAIGLQDDDSLIGDLGLRTTPDGRQAELGFTFSRSHQHEGYASEGVACVVGYAFAELALHRIFSLTDARNSPAIRLLQRCGFREEGRFQDGAWFKGEWTSEHAYALLASEWRARRST